MTSATATGGCACGAIRYRVTGELSDIVNCHCGPCRRITGHHTAATSTPPDELHIESEVTLRWYQRTDDVRYGFCVTCGSTLFWCSADKPKSMVIMAGSIDQPTGLRTTMALFVGEHGDYFTPESVTDTHQADWNAWT